MFVRSEHLPLDVSFPAINSRFRQALVNFRWKSFFVKTLVQSKQICSFHRRRRNTHYRLFGRSEWNRFFPLFNQRLPNVIRDTSCKSRHSSFLAQNANEKPSSETSRPLATSSLALPLHGLTYSTLKFMWNSWGRLVASLKQKRHNGNTSWRGVWHCIQGEL